MQSWLPLIHFSQVVLLSEENSDVKSQLREEQEAREVEKNERLQEKREDDRKRQEMEEKHMNEKFVFAILIYV